MYVFQIGSYGYLEETLLNYNQESFKPKYSSI